MLRLALGIAVGGWMSRYKSMAAPFAGTAKITAIKALQLDFQFDGCLIKIETDAGLVGADPLAIEKHFYRMTSRERSRGSPSTSCWAGRSAKVAGCTPMETR